MTAKPAWTVKDVLRLADDGYGDALHGQPGWWPRYLFHGTTAKALKDIVANGLTPGCGEFVARSYGGELEEAQVDCPELLFFADVDHLGGALGAAVYHIGLEHGSDDPWSTVTTDDLVRDGALVVVEYNDDIWRYDEDQYSRQVGGTKRIDTPSTVEPGDYWTAEEQVAAHVISGKVLADLMRVTGDYGWKRLVDNAKRKKHRGSNPPVLESDDLIAMVRAGIQRAVREKPGRMTHGNTGKNAFVIVGDRIYGYNEYDGASGWRGSGGVSVHSHSGDNWRGSAPETVEGIRAYMDKMYREHMHEGERKQPLNSADILAFVTGLRNGDLSATALLYYDGTFELLAPNAKAEPGRLEGLLRLKRKDFARLLDVPYAVAAKAWDERKAPTETLERERLRDFAKQYGLLYLENLRWS